MRAFKNCIIILLAVAIVLGLTSCGTEISEGVYCKSKKLEFPYISIESENESEKFAIYADADTVYEFSGGPNSDGEYVANFDEYICVAISRKNMDSIKVDVRKRVSSVAASIDMAIYKKLKGTYSKK